jgi:hypothetical protein
MRSSSLHERWPHGILVTTVDDEACREAEGVIVQAIEVME